MDLRENLRMILVVSAVFFAILAIFQLNGWTLEEKNQPPKEVVQVLKLEAFSNEGQNEGQNEGPNVSSGSLEKEVALMGFQPETSFCSRYNGAELETKCNALTRQGCNKVSCCGYLNVSKCVAGSKSGPTFLTDLNGDKIVVKEWQ
jgi:hypothetical protein